MTVRDGRSRNRWREPGSCVTDLTDGGYASDVSTGSPRCKGSALVATRELPEDSSGPMAGRDEHDPYED